MRSTRWAVPAKGAYPLFRYQAIVRAGGAGVFIDNCALAHGGRNWLEMAEDGGPDALSFAFVAIIRGEVDVWTMGMHVLGLRDVVMKRGDLESGDCDVVEVVRNLCRGEKPLADLCGPRFQVFEEECGKMPAGSPLHNPFGCLRLVAMRDIAESN